MAYLCECAYYSPVSYSSLAGDHQMQDIPVTMYDSSVLVGGLLFYPVESQPWMQSNVNPKSLCHTSRSLTFQDSKSPTTAMAKIGVTGATGALGALALKDLVSTIGADSLVALVRSPAKAADLGIAVRIFDYDKPETLQPALEGIEKLLFVSSPDIGERVRQQSAVVDAAKAAGAFSYTHKLT